MAQYFDFPVRVSPADENVEITAAKWSDLEPVLAIATRAKRVYFIQEEVLECRCSYVVVGLESTRRLAVVSKVRWLMWVFKLPRHFAGKPAEGPDLPWMQRRRSGMATWH